MKFSSKLLSALLMAQCAFVFAKSNADTIFYVLFEFLNNRIPNLSEAKKLKYG